MIAPSTSQPATRDSSVEISPGLDRFPPVDSQEALARKVGFLRRRSSYPTHPTRVETVQSHMSWVFLAGDRAYKLKKPVVMEVLDFSTLELRRLCCHRETRLNRRLAPGVYLDSVPLTVSPNGRLHLGGDGEPVEWLVEMRRLPREQALTRRIRARSVGEGDLESLAHLLIELYQLAPTLAVGLDAYRLRFEREIRGATEVLASSQGRLPRDLVMALACTQMRFLGRHETFFEERLEAIVEGHGDLRPEHVFFLEPQPVVIDTLEFDRRLRVLDPADELAYLDLECRLLGAKWIGTALFDLYSRATGDIPPPELLHFYRCHRAFVRAKIAYWHLRDCSGVKADRWLARARTYLGLAAEEMVGAR